MRKKGTWKTKRKGRLRQGLGFVLSAAMVMSLSGGSILTAYAAGGAGMILSRPCRKIMR